MKKTFTFGKIDFGNKGVKNNLVTVEVAYKEDRDKRRFSVCGNVWNARKSDIVCGGQCLDTIAEYITDPVFSEILRLWKLYHLNDMHPECEHQAAAGWRQKAQEEVTLYHWRMTREALAEQKEAERAALVALRCGETFKPTIKQRFFANLNYSLTTHTDTPPANIAKWYEAKTPLYAGDKGHTEKKTLGWLRETEHPAGLLSKACPVCGYKYGTEWKYFPIPAEDEAIICDLLKAENA